MIGDFAVAPPAIDDALSEMVESHRTQTGQDYAAILFFGLWGTVDCSPEVRLYAAYRHLADHPADGFAWLEASRAHLENGDAAAAEKILDELVRLGCPELYPELYSEDPEVHRAYLAAETGDTERALALLDRLRVKHDDSPVYRYFLASLLHESGDLPAAVVAYGEALEALETFRLEAEGDEGGLGEVDFAAAAAFIAGIRTAAERGHPFAGIRPLDISGFREE